MSFQCVNCRVIPPVDCTVDGARDGWTAYEVASRAVIINSDADASEAAANAAAAAPQPTMLTQSMLSEVECRQLEAAVSAVFGTPVSVDAFFSGELDDEMAELRELPVECWDVLNSDGDPVFQLWLCHVDCGTMFTAGTTEQVAYVAQFHLHDFAGNKEALESARAHAAAAQSRSMLATLHISD
jgi:hypothetical protein